MSLDEQIIKFRALDEWFLSEQGNAIANAFFDKLALFNEFLHGDSLLQLGRCGDNSFFSSLRFKHKWIVSPYNEEGASFVSLLNQLPIDRDSVDCVIAPLTLEAFPGEKNPLDEIDRVLKPLGYVVFFGVNPMSIWGWWLRAARNTCYGQEHGRPKSVFSLKRLMLYRGYMQCYLSSFYFIPPVKNKNLIRKLEILNEVGKMISPMPAGFYCFVVQKHQNSLIPLTTLKFNTPYRSNMANKLQPTCLETK